MTALTLEQVQARIKRNFPEKLKPPRLRLVWVRESETSIMSDCGRYRIAKERDTDGEFGYQAYVFLPSVPNKPVQLEKLCDLTHHADYAKETAQAHARGEPVQGTL